MRTPSGTPTWRWGLRPPFTDMKLTPKQIKERLTALASRREMEGIYTDEMLCLEAVELIADMQKRLEEKTAEAKQ